MKKLDITLIIGLHDLAAEYIKLNRQIKALKKLIQEGTAVYVNILPQSNKLCDHQGLNTLNNRAMSPFGLVFTQAETIVSTKVLETMLTGYIEEQDKIRKVLTGANYQLKEMESQIKEMLPNKPETNTKKCYHRDAVGSLTIEYDDINEMRSRDMHCTQCNKSGTREELSKEGEN